MLKQLKRLTLCLLFGLIAQVTLAQGGFGPAPAGIKQFMSSHFQAVKSGNEAQLNAQLERGFLALYNDSLPWFKKDVMLGYTNITIKQVSGNRYHVLVRSNTKIKRRLPSDLLRSKANRQKLRDLGYDENSAVFQMYSVKKSGGKFIIAQ